jgi:hypothetical protein
VLLIYCDCKILLDMSLWFLYNFKYNGDGVSV